MPEFHSSQSRFRTGGTARFAAAAVVLFFAALGGASILSRKLDNGELPSITIMRSEQGLKRMAKSAPVGQAARQGGRNAAARAPGVDATATAAISSADAGATSIAPCGQPSQSVFVVRSVGMDGAATAVLPPQGAPGGKPCGGK